MALQSSGAISLNDIAGEFGGSTPHSLSEYYAAASGVPSSGAIDFADFYGTASGPATNGLIFNLDARNSSSYTSNATTWYDLTSNNRDFSLYGSPTGVTNAISFSGSSQHAYIADGTWIPEGTSAKSFEMMIQIGSPRWGSYDLFVSKTSANNQSFSFGLDHTTANPKLVCGTQGGGSFIGYSSAIYTLPSSFNSRTAFHHYAFTYDGSVLKMYVDASLVYTSGSGKSLHSNTANLRLMCFNPLIGYYYWPVDGDVRFARMYNRALSASEITSNMNA
jgi:hypothetical protein